VLTGDTSDTLLAIDNINTGVPEPTSIALLGTGWLACSWSGGGAGRLSLDLSPAGQTCAEGHFRRSSEP
jgi:hypothetical protein